MFAQSHRYASRAAPQNEQAVLSQYLPLVKRIASQLRSHCNGVLALEDLEQLGLMALLESIRRYPGDVDTNFAAVASKRIRGAMLDELRRLDWRSRQTRQAAHEYNDAQRQLTRQLGRVPRDPELAQFLNISIEALRQRSLDAHADAMHSLDDLLQHQEPAIPSDDQSDLRDLLKRGLSRLQQRQQVLLSLYYHHDLNLKEIALVLKVTEARVCQLHKAAVTALRQAVLELDRQAV
ncbi:RNA polymerase sigma factor FliA [uncultured Ferrimonas sp.]|uniref:RNA polymerase sigma factor FliA n=1 Tax=uncultured Ferrimonas sp. TaxID=432640 RepID=UPI002611F9F1|nr:RNA polymerase sigma factor FliA [uncultured Ferrimonas sp.]